MNPNLPHSGPQGRALIPGRKLPHASTRSDSPHPRHRTRSLHDPWGTITPTDYHDHQFHLIDDDFDESAAHHFDQPAAGHDDHTINLTELESGASSNSLSTRDRLAHSRIMGSLRSRGCGVGDRDRLARVELPFRRSKSDWLLFSVPNGIAVARRSVRGSRVSRLVCSALRRQGLGSGRSVAVCVLGLLTLAALALEVL